EPPPSYEAATGLSSSRPSTPRVSTDGPPNTTERNGIPPERRRSMEDENRPLPPGWVRCFDPQEQHQFFVDTTKDPPRSIWVHPYDDDEFLSTLSPEERRKHSRLRRSATLTDVATEDTDVEDDDDGGHAARLPPRVDGSSSSASARPSGIHALGRKMKDKLTGTTYEQRERQRRQRAEHERQAYIAHLRARQAMLKAWETGEPQFLCKDATGRDVYVLPPDGQRAAPYGAYGYNPFLAGPYAMAGGRYVRPVGPYGRPMGYGYGGGIGAPVAAGFLGGALLGGLMF
ncbi:uncharacterized protein EI97DRAFT_351552, partial [Westerdykella ornata]